jgi:hypothetical protein
MNSNPPIDPVTVAIAIAGTAFSPQLAQLIGPYAVIVLAAILGAGISAGLRDQSSRTSTLLHMVTWVGLSLLFTVPLSMLVMAYAVPEGVQLQWLLGPVATLIAGVGHRWPQLLVWLVIERGWMDYLPGRKREPQ